MASSLTELLQQTAEKLEETESVADWMEEVRSLPDGPRSLAVTYAAMPQAAEGFAAELEGTLPSEQLAAVRRIGERGRELGEEDELERFLRSLSGEEEEEVWEYYVAKEDPLQVMRTSSKISLDSDQLVIRVIGGASHENLNVDFVKTPLEIINLAGNLLVAVGNGIGELIDHDFPVERFADVDGIRERLSEIRDRISEIDERLEG